MSEIIINKLIDEISIFLNADKEEVLKKLDKELFRQDSYVAECWNISNPVQSDEIEDFYKKTDAYIYNLSVWNAKYERQKITLSIINKLENRNCIKILDFGAGIGNDCISLHEKGFSCDYFDLKGLTSEFARWKFERLGYSEKIKQYHEFNELPQDYYDAVICRDVLEHTVNPIIIIEKFSKILKTNGYLLVTEAFAMTDEDFPCHLKQNSKYTGKIPKIAGEYGFLCLSNKFYEQPLEFIKMDKNISFFIKLYMSKYKNYVDLLLKGLDWLTRV